MLKSVLIDKMYLAIVYSPHVLTSILMSTVWRVKSKRCHGKVNSIVDFEPSSHAQLFNRNQSFLVWIIPEPPAPILLDKGNGGSGNEIGDNHDHPKKRAIFVLMPVYTVRFVGPIYRPNGVGAQILRAL